MRYVFFLLLMGFLHALSAQQVFQLAPPIMEYKSVIFEKSATVYLKFAQKGARIRYTTDGRVPTEMDSTYTHPVHISTSGTTLKAKVFAKGFTPSEVVSVQFWERGKPLTAVLHTAANPKYEGGGATVLNDGEAGNMNFRDSSWLGFDADTVAIGLIPAQPTAAKELILHVLENQDAWIFPPQKIEVFGQVMGKHQFISLGEIILDPAESNKTPECRSIRVPLRFTPILAAFTVKIYPLSAIPDNHPGHGSKAWLFIDEITIH